MKFISFILYVIILYISIIIYRIHIHNKCISGFYIANDQFCKNIDIDDIILYINNDTNYASLSVTKNNKLIEYTKFKITLSPDVNLHNCKIHKNSLVYNLNMKKKKNSKKSLIQGDYKLAVSLESGIIVLYKDSVIYCVLYKDNINSNELL